MEFETEEKLIQIILDELDSTEHSISSLWRLLKNDRGMKIHRLELTGYLKAMTDLGILKEKPRPPSKYFTVAAQGTSNIYELVGKYCDKLDLTQIEKGSVVLYLLYRMFRRPVLIVQQFIAGTKI